MCWLKREIWKAGIAVAGALLFLVLMVWVPVSAADAYESSSGLATPVTGTVQAIPTQDATVTTLNKEKLVQEVAQQQHTWENWLWSNAAAVSSALVIALGALFGLGRWLGDRRSEREKRAEERFQSAVTGLGDEKEGAKISAVIMLHTFLQPGYERFYKQAFDLAVAYLRLRKATPDVSGHLSSPKGLAIVSNKSHSQDQTHDNPSLAFDSLSQAFITVFRESFPRIRNLAKKQNAHFDSRFLDATGVQLDNAYLYQADLAEAWLPYASLQKANLEGAHLEKAYLRRAHLEGAFLRNAHLEEADLEMASLQGANLVMAYFVMVPSLEGVSLREANHRKTHLTRTNFEKACLEKAHLEGANLKKADLQEADLKKAHLQEADLRRARLERGDLRRAHLEGAYLQRVHLEGAFLMGSNLQEANLNGADLSGATVEDALSLKDANLRGVTGLTKEQLEACKAKGAIIDEDTTPSSSQAPVLPPSSSQSNDVQTPSAPPAQVSTPTPGTDGSSTTSSQPSPGA